jgi:hypothetical protein
MLTFKSVFYVGLAFAALLSTSPSTATEGEQAASAADVTQTQPAAPTPAQAPVPAPKIAANPLGAVPLGEGALATTRGGTEVLNVMRVRGTVSDNRAVNVVTGSNTMSDGSLANASGLPMVIQNTGNNVLIQNATIVNVQMK